MGMLLDAISGAGKGLSEVATQQQDILAKQQLAKQMSDLEEAKAGRIAEKSYELTNRAANQAGAYLKEAMGGQVPATAAAPTVASGMIGATADYPEGNPNTGFKGISYAKAVADANRLPMSDRAGALAQIEQQFKTDSASAQGAETGTRAPTFAEGIKSAQNKALSDGNVQVYTALKAMAADRFVTVPDGGAIIDTTTGEVTFQSTGKNDRAAAHDDAMIERAQIAADASERNTAAKIKEMGGNFDRLLGNSLIASEDANLRASTTQMMILNSQLLTTSKADRPALQSQIASLAQDISTIQGRKRAYFKAMGVAGSEAEAPVPTAPPASTGSKLDALFPPKKP